MIFINLFIASFIFIDIQTSTVSLVMYLLSGVMAKL